MIELKVKWPDGMHTYQPAMGENLDEVCGLAEHLVFNGGAEYAAVYEDGEIYTEYES